jgi:hypothetical protein
MQNSKISDNWLSPQQITQQSTQKITGIEAFYIILPAYISLIIAGLLILIFIYILIVNFRSFLKTNYITQLQIIGTLGIVIGVHGGLNLAIRNGEGYPILFSNLFEHLKAKAKTPTAIIPTTIPK